ncbi:hypothetical protein FPOAC1_010005 [Fusarium poae]|uniref:hypothetical protein n=1 Tax=Fusarium poae TaxID=36050 RepID=UPI001CE9ACDA|nr:hypothetical protein FPOAC1_010005 [Fusarium poae]KAG8670580.1 hypothetical protein FPOAC1_010005 [Fusarium poae]
MPSYIMDIVSDVNPSMDQSPASFSEPEVHAGPHSSSVNPIQAPNSSGSFKLFPMLPRELRDLIWWHSLARERLLMISLLYHTRRRRAVTNSSLISTQIVLHLNQRLEPIPILFVNKESRRTALQFYRIRIPCYSECPFQSIKGILYFNPDFDIFHFELFSLISRWAIHFVTLSQELQKVDPKGLGLRKIALDERNSYDAELDYFVQIDGLKQAISAIPCVMFSLEAIPRKKNDCVNDKFDEYDRSISPNTALHPCVRRLPQDSRLVYGEMGCNFSYREYAFKGPAIQKTRCAAFFWMRLRDRLKVQSPCEHKLILSSRLSCECFFQASLEAHRCWRRRCKRINSTGQPEAPNKELETCPKTAHEYWIFPLEVLGRIPLEHPSSEESEELDRTTCHNLTVYRPESALYALE